MLEPNKNKEKGKMRKNKKTLLTCLLAVLALCLGLAFAKPAVNARAEETTLSAENWSLVVEEHGAMFRIQNGSTYWTTGEGTYVTPELIMNNSEINGKTLAQINAEKPGALSVTLQPAGGSIGSFFRVNINSEIAGFTAYDIGTFVVRAGWSHTDSSGTFTINKDLYFAHEQNKWASDSNSWKYIPAENVVDISNDITLQDQGIQSENTRAILITTSDKNYWTADPITPNEGGASFLNNLFINGTSIKEWNDQAHAKLDAGEISDITFGAGFWLISNGPSYAPIAMTNSAYVEGLGSYAQVWIPTNYISNVSSFKVAKGFANLQGDTLYYVSKDVEYVKSGSTFVKVASTVDITDAFKIIAQDYTADNGTMLYYLHTDNVQYWTQQYGSDNPFAINEGEWKNEPDTEKQGGAVQMSYIELNGEAIYDINARDNGAYGATQGNIASGSKYAPILAFLTTQELGNAIKLQIPSAYPSGATGENHKTITIKKGFFVLDTITNIKYEVTKDIQWDHVGNEWVEHVNLIETTVTDARLFGSSADAFAGVALAGSDYSSAPSTYAGDAKMAKDYARSANFLSHVLIDDVPLASPGEAFLNVWSNFGYFTFRPGNNSATKITILAGCQFPTYNALLTGAKEAYVTTEDVTFVKEGDTWVQKVEEEFDIEAYKAEKIAEIEAYKAGLFLEEQTAQRAASIATATATISTAADKETIDAAVATAKAEIDALPTASEILAEQLKASKEAAIAELNAYLADGEYSAIQVIDRASAVAKGLALINDAGSEEAIADALADAKAAVDVALARVANYVDVVAVVKITNEYKPGGNFNVYVVFEGVDATAGDHTYAVKIGDVLEAFGFWSNVYVGDKSLKDWGVTGGWDSDNVIGYNVSEPQNNVHIRCHSEDWKTSDVEFVSGIVSNYEMTIKEGTLIPSQAYFTGADTYDVYRVKLEMISEDEEIAYSFKAHAETDVVDVQLAQDNGGSVYLAVGLSKNDYPSEGGYVEVADLYYGNAYNSTAYWVNVKINGTNGIGKYAIYNLNEGGHGRIALTVQMPYAEINSITIPAGTIFPTYALQTLKPINGGNVLVMVLKTTKDVTFVKTADGSWVNFGEYKAEALEMLESAKAGLAEADYFANRYAQITEAYNVAVATIEGATTAEAIDSAVETAIAAMQAVPAKAGVISAAKEEIAAYKADKFRAEEEAQRLAIVAEAQAAFEACESEEALANLLAGAKADVDELKTAAQYADEELAEVKASAREEIANYLALENYYANEQAEIALAIEAGNQAIAEATSEETIAQAVANAKAELDEILTKEEVVAQIKAELNAYKAEDVFRAEEQADRDAIVAEALASLEGLTDLAEINAIVEGAYEAIDELTTNDEYIEAELAEAKLAAKAEIEAYLADGDYIPSQERFRQEAVADALEAIAEAKTVEEIAEAVEEAKAYIDQIAASVTVVDTAMMVRITDIYHAGGNLNMFIVIPGLDVGTAGDGLAFDYSKESLEALFNEFGLFDMVYINDKSLREWGFVGFWNGSLGFNIDGPTPHIYLHMHTDNPDYSAAVESGEITFTKYTNGALDIKQSAITVKDGLLIPGYAYLNGDENAVVYRAVADFVTAGEHRPYDIEANAYTNVDSIAYVQEDRPEGVFVGGYLGISLEGDDFPAVEGDHIDVNPTMLNYASFNQIIINGEAGLVGTYALFNLGENGKGRIAVSVSIPEADMQSITIPEGTIFPAYASNVLRIGDNTVFFFYRIAEEVTFVKTVEGEWVKLADYIQSAKDELDALKAEKETLNCFASDLVLIETTVADAKVALDEAEDAAEVLAIFNEAKAIIEAIQAKDVVIADANAELDAYKAGLFRAEEEAQRAEAVATAKEAIAVANSSEEVANIVASAIEAIDALKTANEYAKEEIAEDVVAAKEALDAYKAEDGLYRAEEAEARLAIIEEAKAALDEALSIEVVESIVAEAKAAIDALKTDAEYDAEEYLAGVKADAIAEISAMKAQIDLSLYTEESILAISTLYNNAKTAIETAETEEAVVALVEKFEADLDAVPMIGEETPATSESKSSGGCFGDISGLSSVFALLSVMAVAVVLKKKR